jgi:hypothetical protein
MSSPFAGVRSERLFDDSDAAMAISTSSHRAQFRGHWLAYAHAADSIRLHRRPPPSPRTHTDVDADSDSDDMCVLRATSDFVEPAAVGSSGDISRPVGRWRTRHRVPVRALAWQRGWLVAADGHGNLSALRDAQLPADAHAVDVVLDSAWIAADLAHTRSFAQCDVSLAVLSADRLAVARSLEQALTLVDLGSGAALLRWSAAGVPRAVAALADDDSLLALADDDSLALFDLRAAPQRAPAHRVTPSVGDNVQAIDSRGHLVLLGDCSRAVALLDVRKLATPLLRANAVTKYGIAGVRLAPAAIKTPTPAFIVASDEGEVVAVDGARSDVLRADAVLMGFHVDDDGNFFALSERGTLLAAEHWFAPQCCAVPAKVRHGRFKEDDQ